MHKFNADYNHLRPKCHSGGLESMEANRLSTRRYGKKLSTKNISPAGRKDGLNEKVNQQ